MEDTRRIKDYYSIMGVSRNATLDEIKKAFRDNAKKYHPDVCKLPDAHQRFIEIGEAYEVLSDANARREYDALLNRATKSKQDPYRDGTYNDFKDTQQKAKARAEKYAGMSLEDLITGVLGFAYEFGRAILVGERDKPDVTFRDVLKMGFLGIVLIASIIVSFTGVGTIPGLAIAYITVKAMEKNGKILGLSTLLKSTIATIVLIIIFIGAISLLISH